MLRHRTIPTLSMALAWVLCIGTFLPLAALAQSTIFTSSMPDSEVISSNRYLVDVTTSDYREVVLVRTHDGEFFRITSTIPNTDAKSGIGSPSPVIEHAEYILIELEDFVNISEFQSDINSHGGRIVSAYDKWRLYRITFDDIPLTDNKIEQMLERANGIQGVAYKSSLKGGHFNAIPNDAYYSSQWYHNNTGQTGGTIGSDINAENGWSKQNHASNVVIAVIDSGVLTSHYDLQNNLWINPDEISGNNQDDDGNGYIDDIHGYNFVTRNGNQNPLYYWHGTAVAGVIGAEANNTTGWNGGMAGVAWKVQLMCLNVDWNGAPYVDGIVEAVQYAIDNGADVINCSFSVGDAPPAFSNVFLAARDAGIVVVAASGNNYLNLDSIEQSQRPAPGRLPYDNIVVVIASDHNDNCPIWSNIGLISTDLAAPGVNILTTCTNTPTSFTNINGTSFSAPIVSGALALMKQMFPNLTYSQLIDRLLSTIDPIPSLSLLTATGGRLNIGSSLHYMFEPPDHVYDNGWIWSSWFGTFSDANYPWFYHHEHQFLYSTSVFSTDIWMYDPSPQIGWFWTTDSHYPQIWSSAQNSWLFYERNEANPNPRWFYKYSDNTWFYVYHTGTYSDGPPSDPINP